MSRDNNSNSTGIKYVFKDLELITLQKLPLVL